MFVDSLTHVTPDGRWFDSKLNASEHELLRQLNESETQRSVVVALAGHISNRFVYEVCERHSARLIPCASLNPVAYGNPVDARVAIRAALTEAPYKALKLHPRLNKYDPLDPRCIAVLDELASAEHPLPVWLDTLFYCRGVVLRKPPVDTIHELVGKFPSLRFVLLHACGSQVLQLADAVRDCSNAFLDLSFTLPRYQYSSVAADLRFLVSTFDRRLVFGSDFPEVSLSIAINSFQDVARGLPPEKCANVLGKNLNRLLELE